MAMLISKFHKLIQSKLLWGAFLVIVIFTFVIWGTSMPKSEKNAHNNAPGLLDGKPVSSAQFQNAYFSTYLTVVMAIGRAINITPRIDEQLRKAAWQRIVALRAAEQMGISANDDEVFSAIQQHEGFSYEGQFNKMAYKAFVQNFLSRYGFTERQFEEHVREEIVLQKTRTILDRTTLITPLELQRAFRTVTDRFSAQYIILHPDLVESSVKVTEEDARAFFEKDPKLFTRPEQLKVDFIRVAAAPFIPRLRVDEDEVQAYYDENLREFIDKTATNTADSATNLLAGSLTRYRPLEDVKQEITNRLLEQKAIEEAHETAMNFVVALTPDRDGHAPEFSAVAEQFKLPVQSLGPFAAKDEVPGVEAADAFKHAAFELGEGPETYFSNPVRGSNEVYVIALRERIQPRVPDFEEVKDVVTQIAREQALDEALTKKAEQIREETGKALAEKISFADSLAFYGQKPVTTETFSASTGLADTNAPDREILSAVMTLNQGEVAEPVRLKDGVLLVYLAERKAGETTSMETIRPQLVETIRRQSGRLAFDSWQNYLLQKAHFEDRRPAATQESEEEEQEPAPAPADETTS